MADIEPTQSKALSIVYNTAQEKNENDKKMIGIVKARV
jgi:hypothetical protein